MIPTHKPYIISIQYLSHKCLPEKCIHSLRILIMSWLFKDPVVIMEEIMSWLFKDPINSGLAQFDHAQSNSKNGLRAKKIKLPQMNFFLKKQLITFSCTYWPISFCEIFKKFLGPIQLWGCAIFGSKIAHLPQTNFFWKIINITLIYLLAPLHYAKF